MKTHNWPIKGLNVDPQLDLEGTKWRPIIGS
jgi:hypothetical protein